MAFVSRIITYVADLVAVSVLLDGAPCVACDMWTQLKKTFHSWVMDTFRRECLRLLPPELYSGNFWDGGENPVEEAIICFGLEPAQPGRLDEILRNPHTRSVKNI